MYKNKQMQKQRYIYVKENIYHRNIDMNDFF